MNQPLDLFVVGAGVAGLSAAIEAARQGLSVAVAEEAMFGGLIMNVNHLRPGVDGMAPSGSDLAADLMSAADEAGADMVFEAVTAVESRADGALAVTTASETYIARNVVIASGARLRKLGAPGEDEFEHRGVSHCADCDGPLYRGKAVMVVGGGDSALQEALSLAQFCSVVRLVHRGGAFSARADFVEAVAAAPQIEVRLNTVVEGLRGGEALSSVRLRGVASNAEEDVATEGFFAYVGLEPNAGFLPMAVARADGHVRVDENLETSMPNVFAIGAARSGFPGEIRDAAADAKQAVAAIARRLRPG